MEGVVEGFPLPRDTTICLTLEYSMNVAGVDRLSVYLYDSVTGGSQEVWRQRFVVYILCNCMNVTGLTDCIFIELWQRLGWPKRQLNGQSRSKEAKVCE